jgi:hypothetical protein
MRRMKIIQYRDGKWGAKRKTWYGWAYLNEIYDGNWSWHYAWLPRVPDGVGINDRFESKRDCVNKLSEYYHGHRKLQEKI